METLLKLLGAPGEDGAPLLHTVTRVFSFGPSHLALLSAVAGGALLVAALVPLRMRSSLDVVRTRPLAAWLLGAGILLALAAALAGLMAYGVRPGRGLLLVAGVLAGAGGSAVSARWLGERLAPELTSLAQLGLGLGILLLCLGSVFGLPVMALLAPLGLGALVLARR